MKVSEAIYIIIDVLTPLQDSILVFFFSLLYDTLGYSMPQNPSQYSITSHRTQIPPHLKLEEKLKNEKSLNCVLVPYGTQ